VSGSGLNATVTAVANGTAAITAASVDDPTKKASCNVTVNIPVPVPVTDLTVNPTAMTLKVGESEWITAVVQPENATNKNVVWETGNGNATISSTTDATVTVTAAYVGTTAVKVTASDGGKTAACTVTSSPAPAKEWKVVSAGGLNIYPFKLAIKTDGSLWAWGNNYYYALGLGTDSTNRLVPTRVGTDNNWLTVSAGWSYALAIKTDGSLWAWGNNYNGNLGVGDTTDRYTPARVGNANDWKTVCVGAGHTLAIKTDGSLWAWGRNNYGQLGLGNSDNNEHRTPVQVGTAKDWKVVSACHYHALAIKTDGSLWAWGYNDSGQLGLADNDKRDAPVRVGSDNTWATVSVGGGSSGGYTMGIKADGSLWGWGKNNFGQLGVGGTNDRNFPVRVGTDNNWAVASASNDLNTMAIKTDGSLWAWGRNNRGQCGHGPSDDTTYTYPVRVGTYNNWAAVSLADEHTAAIKIDNSLWAWGDNRYGQLGVGDTKEHKFPVLVGATSN